MMNTSKKTDKALNSKGAPIFKKMLEDKRAIRAHLQKGGKLSDLKDQYRFATPLSVKGS